MWVAFRTPFRFDPSIAYCGEGNQEAALRDALTSLNAVLITTPVVDPRFEGIERAAISINRVLDNRRP